MLAPRSQGGQRRYTGGEMVLPQEVQAYAFAEVAVNASAPIRQTFTYRVPDGLGVVPGQAVYVPFGARTLQGIVMDVTDATAYPEARDIGAVIDQRPLLSPAHIAVARWMSAHYLAPLFDCVSLMLPPGSKRRPVTVLTPLATIEELPSLGLTDKQARALAYIIERREARPEDLKRELGFTNVPLVVSALLRRGFVLRSYRLARPAASPKLVRQLRLVVAQRRDGGALRSFARRDRRGRRGVRCCWKRWRKRRRCRCRGRERWG